MERPSQKFKCKLKLIIGLLWGIAVIIVAFALVYSIGGNPYYEYKLFSDGITTDGFITGAREDVEPKDAGGYTYYYNYSFKFKLPNGRTVHAYQEVSGDSPQNPLEVSESNPIKIIYLKNNPEVNKLMITLSDSVWEIVWRKVGVGLLLFVLLGVGGFVLVRNAIKEYTAEMNLIINQTIK